MSSETQPNPVNTQPASSTEAQLLLLAEASDTLIRGENPAVVVRRILDLARRIYAADAYAIWRRQDDGVWRIVEQFGLPEDYPAIVPAADWVLPEQPFAIEDVQSAPLVGERAAIYGDFGIRSLLGLPLLLHNRPAGTIAFYYQQPRRFTKGEVRVASALGNLASAAITSSEVYQEQRRLRMAAEEAQRRLTFLSEASAVLTSSLDYETTLRHVAQLVVPHLADWCTVHLVADDESREAPRQVAVTHVDPDRLAWAESLKDRYPYEADALQGLPNVLRTGQSELYPEITDEMLRAAAQDADHLEILRQVGFTSCMIVPLRCREGVLGAITFISAESGSHYGPEHLTLAEALADRAASAIENARLYQRAQDSVASLQRSEARARRLFESGVVATTIWKRDGRILDANDVFLSLVGYTREDLQTGLLSWETLTPPEWREITHQRSDTLESTRIFPPYEKEYFRKDGTRVPVLVGGALFDDSDDEGISFILDTTEPTILREELQRHAAELAEANRRKDEFLAMLGHELRNPLAPVLSALQLIRLRAASHADLEYPLEVMDRQVHHLTRLVDDLLDVARITRGTVAVQPERVDVVQVVQRAVDGVQPRTLAGSHHLQVRVPDAPVWVEADPTRLEQIVSNLLGNAVKYTPQGGDIQLTVQSEDGWVEIRVRDNGFGISPALLPHIFEPFTQGAQSLARSQGGLGIGLTLVERLVRMHGGEISAFSEGEGQGSEFVVRLPSAPSAAAGDTRSGDASAVRREARTRVLVVDDNRDAADTLGELIEAWGHEVRVAHSGVSGLEEARDFHPELVLLDLGMPGMDGYEVARHVLEDPGLAGLHLVALTGYGQEEDRRRTREAGFAEHLVKPIGAEELRRVLQRFAPRTARA